MSDPNPFGTLLQQSLAAAVGVCPDARRAFITVGEVALDDCCNGQVWARLIEVVAANTDQRSSMAAQACGVAMWDVTVGIGSARCAHVVDDNGNAPTPAELCDETLDVTFDMQELVQAITCQLAPYRDKVRFLRWLPLGPEGGCVGGEWQISVLMPNEVCC